MKNPHSIRLSSMGIILSLIGALLMLQLVRIQTSAATNSVANSSDAKNTVVDLTIDTKRGDILDRWGAMLAGSKTVYEIGVDLGAMVDKQAIATTLASITGIDANTVLARINEGLTHPNYVYIRLTDFIDLTQEAQIMAVKQKFQTDGSNSLGGLMATPHLQRTYPDNTLASNILGFYSLSCTRNKHKAYERKA